MKIGVLGDSSSMRFGMALQHASFMSLMGRRIVVVNGTQEFFPVSGKPPLFLAPYLSQNTPVDVVAEWYASFPDFELAVSSFAKTVLSTEGMGINRNSNDAYWTENLRMGLETFFRVAGFFAKKEKCSRSMGAIISDCMQTLGPSALKKGSSQEPDWLGELPKEIRDQISSCYIPKPHYSTALTHYTTIQPFVQELRKVSPKKGVSPHVANPQGDPLFIPLSDWESSVLYLLLQVCMKAGAFFIFPNIERWSEADRHRIGYFLSTESSRIDALWTSNTVPKHQGFESEEMLYGHTQNRGVLDFFAKQVSAQGPPDEARLENLPYETPASLDEEHLLYYKQGTWSLQKAHYFDENLLETLDVPPREHSYQQYFENNLEESHCEEQRKKKNHGGSAGEDTKKGQKEIYLLEGCLRETHREGDLSFYLLEEDPLCLYKAPSLQEGEYLGIIEEKQHGKKNVLGLYKKIWGDRRCCFSTVFYPEVKAFLPVSSETIKKTSRSWKGKDVFQISLPLMGGDVDLVFAKAFSLPQEKYDVAYGTWLAPRRVFLVHSLLQSCYLGKEKREPLRIPGHSQKAQHFTRCQEALYDNACEILENIKKPEAWKNIEALGKTLQQTEEQWYSLGTQLAESLLSNQDMLKKLSVSDLYLWDEDVSSAAEMSRIFPLNYTDMLVESSMNEDFERVFHSLLVSSLVNVPGVFSEEEKPGETKGESHAV